MANPAAIRTYCSGLSAINSGRPRFLSWEGPLPNHRLTHDRNDGHPHPERVQAGGMPVVGDRIEANVDAVVDLEILRARSAGNKGDAVGRDRFPFQQIQRVLAVAPFGSQDQQLRAIDGLEDLPAQSFTTAALTLQKLLKHPKVTEPFSNPAGR